METLNTGPYELRRKHNELNKVTTLTTAAPAIPVNVSGHYRLNHATMAATVAAPTVEGVEIKIDNVNASATVTVTGLDVTATADVFTLAATGTTARASLVLKAIRLDTTSALVWSSFMGAGVTVA